MSRTAYKWMPEIETDACMGCGLCEKACPPKCIELVWDFATLKRAEDCTSCGACAEVCPHEVIRMDWILTTGSPVVGEWRDAPPPVPARPQSWLRRLAQKLGLRAQPPEAVPDSCPM